MYADPLNRFTNAFRAAFLIGIDAYKEGLPSLTNAVRDVDAVADALKRQHGFQIVCKLTNEQATLARIREALAELRRLPLSEGRLVFYFAGHGISEPTGTGSAPEGYFIPQDAEARSPQTFLPMREVYTALRELGCHQMLIVLDCCFSGAFRFSTRDVRSSRGKMYLERFTRYLADPAWQVITSTAPNERALDVVVMERPLGVRAQSEQFSAHSPFAQALLEGLAGGADRSLSAPGDGLITAAELHRYIEARLQQLETIEKHRQRSLLFSLPDGELGEFLFQVPGAPINLLEAARVFAELNPYRGLQPYTSKDAKLFFGREQAVTTVSELVATHRVTLVTGETGVGKSSLICAGLLPHFIPSDAAGQQRREWRVCPVQRPGPSPLQLLQRLAHHLSDRRTSDLQQAITKVLEQNPKQRLLIVIDQLEEVTTMCPLARERKEFLDHLIKLIEIPGVHLLLGLRADALPTIGETLRLGIKEPAFHVFRLPSMTPAQLREAIEGPARETALFFEPPTLVDTIIGDVLGSPGALSLLSYTLSEMFRTYTVAESSPDGGSRTLAQRHYDAIGGAQGVLQKTLDEVDAELSAIPEARRTLRRILARLVSRKGTLIARRRVNATDLRYADDHNPEKQDVEEDERVFRVLEVLEDRHLVISDVIDADRYYELAHDRLALSLPPSYLTTVLDAQPMSTDRSTEEQHMMVRAVNEALRLWQTEKEHPARLWTQDPRLDDALAMLREDRFRFNASEREFLLKSERGHEELAAQKMQKQRRRVQLITALVVCSILSVIGLVSASAYFWWLRRDQKLSRLASLHTMDRLLSTIGRHLEPVIGTSPGIESLLGSMSELVGELDGQRPAPLLPHSPGRGIERALNGIDRDPQALRADLKVTLSFGSWARRQGRLDLAEPNLKHALAIRSLLDRIAPLGDQPDPQLRLEDGRWRAQTLLLSGQIRWARHEMAVAGSDFSEYIREIRGLLDGNPGSDQLRHDLIVGLERSGGVAMARLAYEQARGEFWSALALARELAAKKDSPLSEEERIRDLIISLNNVGLVEEATGHNEQAQAYYFDAHQRTITLYQRYPSNRHYARDLSISHGKLGDIAMAQNRFAEARQHYDEAIRIGLDLDDRDPGDHQIRRELANNYNRRGGALQELADVSSAPSSLQPEGRRKLLADAKKDFLAMHTILQTLINSDVTRKEQPDPESDRGLKLDQSIAFKSLGEFATAQFEESCARADYQSALDYHASAVRLREELARFAEQQGHKDTEKAALADGPILASQLNLITAWLAQARLFLAPCTDPPPDVAAAEDRLCAIRSMLERYRHQYAQDAMVKEVKEELRGRCARLRLLQREKPSNRGCCNEANEETTPSRAPAP